MSASGLDIRPERLLELTAELVAVPSVSFHEGDLAALIEARLSDLDHLEVVRVGDNVVARTSLGRAHRVILAGHTDTVPPRGDAGTLLEADVVTGVGSSDMKSGLAVMLALAGDQVSPPVDLTFVFYAREEVAAEHSGLAEIARERPDLLAGDVAVLGEPTGAQIEAGCQGQVRVVITLGGVRAHTARPWMGVNAIHRLGALLAAVADHDPRTPVVQGLRFRESLQVVRVSGGVAGNVVPDEAALEVSYRFAPDRTPESALRWLEELFEPFLGPGDTVEVVDVAPAAPPAVGHPFVAGMVERHGLEVSAKLGWTDVARFAELGIPAVNLGPGDPTLAHTAGEQVEGSAITTTFELLREAIATGL